MSVRIIIPSFRRAEIICTHKLLDDYEVCIPEGERDAYVRAGVPADKLLLHPDSLIGITKKRNWILSQEKKRPLLMIDDDMVNFQRQWVGVGEPYVVDNKAELRDVIENTAEMCADLGAKLFGIHMFADVRLYPVDKPYQLTGFIAGGCIGFLPDHGLLFDERLVTRGDEDVSFLNAFKHRVMFFNRRYAFSCKKMNATVGGMSLYRTPVSDENSIKTLQAKYGESCCVLREAKRGSLLQTSFRLPY